MPKRSVKLNVAAKVLDAGVEDKRLLVMEGEFSSVLKMLNREGNVLSDVVRNTWDHGNLNTLVKNDPNKATGAHVSVIGHVTKFELLRYLNDTEAGNGFGNRFLWVCARRSKVLPEGGSLQEQELSPLIKRLTEAIQRARTVGRIGFDQEASRIWHEVYPSLSEGKPGLLGAMIGRAEAQVARLSCIYAVLDSSLQIQANHLKAALAVWRYCEASCRYIFGDRLGDPVADEILKALRCRREGMERTHINNLFQGHKQSRELLRALGLLESLGLVKREIRETGGRPAETWYAIEPAEKAEKAK